jgi:excinuclease UvrABC nuclease subunit
MRWDETDRSDHAVVASGTWCPIHEIQRCFPSAAGVFVFGDERREVRYVGKARWPRLGVEARSAIYRSKDRLATVALWLSTSSDADATELAIRLRLKYRPPNNGESGPFASRFAQGGV